MVHTNLAARALPGRSIARLAAALALAAAAIPARATLGEPEDSVPGGAPAARVEAPPGAGAYHVRERTQGGTTIREYVGPDGRVFAVTWSGLAHPDLGPLLGRYEGEYRAAARQARAPEPGGREGGRRALRVEGGQVIVDRWGHMRDRHGRAWLPAQLPAGVDVDDLR